MLVLKLVLVPVLIGLVSLAGRRWGPAVSGILVGLPWTSGPVLLFLALERGEPFAAEAAAGVLAAVISVAAFCFAYAWAAMRLPWLVCTATATLLYLMVTYGLLELPLHIITAFALAALVVAVTFAAMPHGRGLSRERPPMPLEIPFRMLTATLMVVALTGLAGALGPRLAGLLTPFPIYASVLAVFSHRIHGPGGAIQTLTGVLRGSFSFAIFFLVAAIGLETMGIAGTFLAAGASALSLHLILLDSHRVRAAPGKELNHG